MVSIHRILIVLYMTIRVLCFVFRFKRGVESFIRMEVLEYLDTNKQYPTPVLGMGQRECRHRRSNTR